MRGSSLWLLVYIIAQFLAGNKVNHISHITSLAFGHLGISQLAP